MRVVFALSLALLASAAGAQADPAVRLSAAQAAARTAAARADRLGRAAAAQPDPARQARLATAAMSARIAATRADIVAAEARAELVGRLVAAQRTRLAGQQAPVARLLAALQSLAARPPVAAIAQPGSVDDLVHVRAVLGSALPAIRARTSAIRAELDRNRALQRSAGLATRALRDGRIRLEANRLAFVRLEAAHRLRGGAAGQPGRYQSERALALGEQTRDIVGLMATAKDAAAIEGSLATLPGPLPRPGNAPPNSTGVSSGVYRLPAAGRIVTGFGEVSDTGVRSRGLTLATAAGARVGAPAPGRIVYAGPFRGYRRVVVIDHGAGWTSTLTGLETLDVTRGDRVRAGDTLGRAPTGDDPRVTVELRRRGRPIEPAALIG